MILVLLLQVAAPAAAPATLPTAPAGVGATCANPDSLPVAAALKRCQGMAEAKAGRWAVAAAAFEEAARLAGSRSAAPLAQAGNAWLAAGDPTRAATALDAALVASEGVSGFDRGELMLDRARAAVAAGDLPGARGVLDRAQAAVPGDPLVWLLSATLARRSADPARAAKDIAEALRIAPDDAAVQLEAGNIAAVAGDETRAKERWGESARLQPTGPSGLAAKAALAQFEASVVAAPHR